MRKYIQQQILSLLETVEQGIGFVFSDNDDLQQNLQMLVDCFTAMINIEKAIIGDMSENDSAEYINMITEIKIEIGTAHKKLGNNDEYDHKNVIKKIRLLSEKIQNESIKIHILFLPYKLSMWDCMESVWKAACADERCECVVMPIPYFTRNPDMSFNQMYYEGEDYPDYVPVTNYKEYNIPQKRPDIIYIHNPYDDCNYVTSVHPDYYSFNLKKYTDTLVYIPYGMTGNESGLHGALNAKAVGYVDVIITWSDYIKQFMEQNGVKKGKLKVLGSPKTDKVVECGMQKSRPDTIFGKKINGRKVILLNNSIATCLENSNWISVIEDIIKSLASHKECLLIWRPHPLLDDTILSMRPQWSKTYNLLKQYAANSDNIVIDTTNDFYQSLTVSDALVSDYSSVMFLYIITQKPILSIFDSVKLPHKMKLFDYFSNYFLDDGVSIDDFMDIVVSGNDIKKTERIEALKRSLLNIDGTCGQKIHEYVFDKNMKDTV